MDYFQNKNIVKKKTKNKSKEQALQVCFYYS